jgi:hypothetical protein
LDFIIECPVLIEVHPNASGFTRLYSELPPVGLSDVADLFSCEKKDIVSFSSSSGKRETSSRKEKRVGGCGGVNTLQLPVRNGTPPRPPLLKENKKENHANPKDLRELLLEYTEKRR